MNDWKNGFIKKISAMRGTAITTSCDVEIDGVQYREQSEVVVDGQRYVLLTDIHEPSNIVIRRLCEYYDPLESRSEFENILSIFHAQQASKRKASERRSIFLEISLFALTILILASYTLFVYDCHYQTFKNELLCYCLLAVCFCVVNHKILCKSTSAAFVTSILLALGFTASVFLLNNLWRYIYENTRFYWGRPEEKAFYWPYLSVLKSDFLYTIGIGRFRYWLVFLASSVGLYTESAVVNAFRRKRKVVTK